MEIWATFTVKITIIVTDTVKFSIFFTVMVNVSSWVKYWNFEFPQTKKGAQKWRLREHTLYVSRVPFVSNYKIYSGAVTLANLLRAAWA